jgi:hypothetical protein
MNHAILATGICLANSKVGSGAQARAIIFERNNGLET